MGRGPPRLQGCTRHGLGVLSSQLLCRNRNKETRYPQSHGEEQGLEALGKGGGGK